MEGLAFLDEKIINAILEKLGEERNLKIISFTELYKYLGEQENRLVRSFVKLNPRDFGFKGKFLGVRAVPKDLIFVDGHFLSKPVFSAFLEMNNTLEGDIGKRLKIFSGYRSPAYQAIVFLRCLKENKFDFLKTAKGVAFPGYSEHSDSVNHAIDFCPENFEKTEEYKWLKKNANKFGFYLSYPRNNKDGIMFEPWHWRFGK
ncbi:MAG: M15 family metallopeptidase [Patescibacteria group bacterium]